MQAHISYQHAIRSVHMQAHDFTLTPQQRDLINELAIPVA